MSDEPMSDDELSSLQAKVAALQAENEVLRHQDTQPVARPGGHRRWRWTGAIVLLLVAALLTAPALVGFWGRRTLVDSQRFLDTVAPLARSEAIQDAVATEVSDRLIEAVDIQGFINQNLPPQAQALGPAITGAVQNFVQDTVQRFLASDRFDQLWLDVNRTVQQQLMAALNGDQSGSIQIRDGTVYLDVGIVVQAVQQALVDRGLTIFGRVTIPSQTGREIVLLSSDQLKAAQRIWSFSEPIAHWMLPVVILLYVGAVLLAPDRRRMLIGVGVVLVVAMALLSVALNLVRAAYVSATADRPHGAALNEFYDTMLRYLWGALGAILLLGALIVVFAWLAGPSRPAAGFRDLEARGTGMVGSGLGRWAPLAAIGGTIARWRLVLRTVAVAGGVLGFFLVGHATWQNVAWTVLAVVVAWLLIDALAAARPERPPGDGSGEPLVPPQVPAATT
jgi:hypothetical protein